MSMMSRRMENNNKNRKKTHNPGSLSRRGNTGPQKDKRGQDLMAIGKQPCQRARDE